MGTERGGNVRTLSSQSPLIKEDYEYIWIPYQAFTDAGNAAVAAVGGTETYGLQFDKATEEVVDTNVLLPRDLDPNFDISAYVYWSSAGTAATTIVWDFEYLSTSAGDDIGASHTALTTTDTDSTTADAMMITDAMTITASKIAAGDVLHIVVSRDADEAADLVDADAAFYGVRLKYTRRSI